MKKKDPVKTPKNLDLGLWKRDDFPRNSLVEHGD